MQKKIIEKRHPVFSVVIVQIFATKKSFYKIRIKFTPEEVHKK